MCENLGTYSFNYSFVKIPQPGDSKEMFSVSTLSCHVLTSDPKRIEKIPIPTLPQRNNKQTYTGGGIGTSPLWHI